MLSTMLLPMVALRSIAYVRPGISSLKTPTMFRFPSYISSIFLAIALMGLLPSAMVQAGGQRDRQQQDQSESRDQERGLSDAVRRIEREHRGEVLSAERMQFEGREVNRIKVVDDRGRVRVYMDDPHKPQSASDTPPPARRDSGDN